MSMNHLLEAFELIENNLDKCDFETEHKNVELIQKAEKALGLKFPPTYRLFLKNYGCGGIGGTEIYGIIDDQFDKGPVPDGIWATLNQRKMGAPHHYIVIGSIGYGPLYILDASHPNGEGEYPVMLWMPGLPEAPAEKINTDFGEFLLEQVQEELATEDDD